jgi:GT2 family glycosyltransferase
MTPQITVITPTTGNKHVYNAIKSVAEQTIPVNHLVVVDGNKYKLNNALLLDLYHDNLEIVQLPDNTGKLNGEVHYYGFRIYCAMSFVINTPYMVFLDEDNMLDPTFCEEMLATMLRGSYDAVTCRRKVMYEDGTFLGYDNFESVDDSFFDTNTFLWNTKRFSAQYAPLVAYGGREADRHMSYALMGVYGNYKHIEKHLVSYRAPERLYQFFKTYCDS